MYQVSYINPLIQYGVSEYDAILFDDDAVLPSNRIHVKFQTEEPSQEEFDEMTTQLITFQNKLNYDYSSQALSYLREEINKELNNIETKFLAKDLLAYRDTLTDPVSTTVQAVGYIVSQLDAAANLILSQIPNPQ